MNDDDQISVEQAVLSQVEYADSRYGPFTSSHEGLGVLVEEMDELLGAIRDNDLDCIRNEAIQVSAVALRLAGCCGDREFRKRSVK
jgi:hypothetical protein